jgi:hypothetical protein
MSQKQESLVYVWLGKSFPKWMKYSIALSKKNCGLEVILLSNRSAGVCNEVDQQLYIEDFYKQEFKTLIVDNSLEVKSFRDGFWIKTSERFLVLNSYAKKYGIKSFFHAELDVAVFDLTGLAERLNQYATGFYCPRDSVERGIASLIYCNNIDTLECIAYEIRKLDGKAINDMSILGALLNAKKDFYSLPTERVLRNESKSKEWETVPVNVVGGIFDAASIGQYLFGIDPRNTLKFFIKNGFQNENSGCNLSTQTYKINFRSNKAFIKSLRNRNIKIYNLHIHSKLFKKLINQDWVDKVLKNINQNNTLIVKYNFGSTLVYRGLHKIWKAIA